MLSQRTPNLSSFLLICLILFYDSDFHHSIFQLTYPFFCLLYSAIDSFWYTFYFNYCIVHLCFLFYKFSNYLLNISCIFSGSTSIICLRCRIVFTIITLNCFLSRLPISTPEVLSSFFIWNIFFSHLILFNFLWLGYQILFPLVSPQWWVGAGVRGLYRLLGGRYLCLSTCGVSLVLSLWWE